MSEMESKDIYSHVRERYSAAARSSDNNYGAAVAKAFGYSEEELSSIPLEANLGLSCGNPLAIAALREGETVVDLGSGAGFDVFLAADKVGPTGKAIGIDMNKDMLARAQKLRESSGKTNTDFVESRITQISLESDTADCIISNCVVNLVPHGEKQLVFDEMFRLLKTGGRVALSDILAKKDLTEEIRSNMSLYVGCIAGASRVGEYQQFLQKAGFKDILIVDTGSDLNVYSQGGEEACCSSNVVKSSSCCSPVQDIKADLKNVDLNEWAGSYKIYAVKA